MNKRLELHNKLVEILGSRNVYFQPPSNITMKYPAIVYSRKSIISKHASDGIYKQNTSYSIIVIDKNPDSNIVDKMAQVINVSHSSHYIKDNLNHDVFTLKY